MGLLQNLPPPPPELLKPAKSPCAKYLSQENLPINEEDHGKTSKRNGFDTMPRAAGGTIKNQPLFIRRSSSVPCKTTENQGNRGSTSSSDSGFSPGSPSNGQCMTTK